MTDTNAITAAVAHIKQITPEGETWDWGDFAGPMSPQNQIAFAEIASAVASGALVPAADVQGLVKAARRLQADMLERSRFGMDVIYGEEYRIVNAGAGAWRDFCAALTKLENRNG